MIPYQDPHPKDAAFWPVGYRRHKDSAAWVFQGIWLFGTLAGAFALTASEFPGAGIALVAIGLLSVAWIEFEARCEDRDKVMKVFAVIMGLLALWAAARAHQRHQDRENSPW